ncbi:MAG TPA: winged helix DNA-binding domain-containing protein [Cytophagales bacterium]|nr:winged helix DNA-binding domain-containing protein [Cytophagales bacterium]
MQKKHIALQRLQSQHIHQQHHTKPEEVVRWMAAMQAQDYEMVKWGIGVRIHGESNDILVEKALDEGKILRTHVLRPTWHVVAAEDIYWMLELTAPHVKRAASYYNKQLGLDDAILKKSNTIILKALEKSKFLTREAIVSLLQQANIDTNDQRGGHLLFDAELNGLVCSGPRQGKHQTYALLEERVPTRHTLDRDEALATLALRYYRSHGPATAKDFMWWSGLSMGDVKKALHYNSGSLHSEQIEEETYWYVLEGGPVKTKDKIIEVLPAFDEFMVAYTERSASLAPAYARDTISGNGIFKPIIVADGQVIGIWRRISKPKHLEITVQFFESPSEDLSQKVIAKFKAYENFMDKKGVYTII